MNALQELFFAECDDLLARARSLLDASRDVWSSVDLAELHRCVHSIKGGAATFALPLLSDLARDTEFLLDGLRQGRIQPDEQRLELVRQALGLLGEFLQHYRTGCEEPPGGIDAELVRRLHALGGTSGTDRLEIERTPGVSGAPVAAPPEEQGGGHAVLGFRIAGQGYAIDVRWIGEIQHESRVIRLAGAPEPLIGVIDRGDDFVPVVDLRRILGVRPAADGATEAMVICLKPPLLRAALLIEEVGEFLELDSCNVQEAPAFLGACGVDYVAGFLREPHGVRVLFDPGALLRLGGVVAGAVDAHRAEARIEALNARLRATRGEMPGAYSEPAIAGAIAGLNARLQATISGALDRIVPQGGAVGGEGRADPTGGEGLNGLLDYVEEAVDAGQAAIRCQRDADSALSYAERTRETLLLLLGWVTDLVGGLERFVPESGRSGERTRSTQPAHTTASVAQVPDQGMKPSGPGSIGTDYRPPLPKIRRKARPGPAPGDEWEIFRE